jgi:hypothetical protein
MRTRDAPIKSHIRFYPSAFDAATCSQAVRLIPCPFAARSMRFRSVRAQAEAQVPDAEAEALSEVIEAGAEKHGRLRKRTRRRAANNRQWAHADLVKTPPR